MADWPIVGRERELQSLETAMRDPACGGVAFVGAAGVGKTRLASQAMVIADTLGVATATVRATRSASTIPLAALAPLFDRLKLDPDMSARSFRAVSDAVEQLRGDGRVVLVIDDAQELDDASVTLLDQLIDRGGTFVVLTLRVGEGDTDAVSGMWKDEQVERIEVGPLAVEDLRTLAKMAIGGPIDGAALQALVDASSGNVLFLRELIRGALESGTLAQDRGLWRLLGSLAESPRLRDLIRQRLAGLSVEERETLELVALGDPIEASLLDNLMPIVTAEKLESRGLIDVLVGDGGPELRLAHPLYGEVVRAELPTIRKARLSRSLADAVDAREDVSDASLLRAAVWRLDGGGDGRPETTLSAARTAYLTEDYSLAERLSRSAWERWELIEAALILGDSLDFLGRSEEAEQLLGFAAGKASTDQQRTSLAIRRASALFRSLGREEDATKVIDDATQVVRDRACRRELDALRGNLLVLAGDVGAALELDMPLLAEEGDAAFAQASLDVGTALALAGRTREALEHTENALQVRLDLDNEAQLSAVAIYFVAQSLAHLYAGNLSQAAEIAHAGYHESVARQNDGGQAWFASVLGLIRINQGQLVQALNLYREVATLFRQLNHPAQRWGLGGIALAAGQMGDTAVGSAALADLEEIDPAGVRMQDVAVSRGRAWTAVALGELSAARKILWNSVETASNWGQFSCMADALHDLVRIGEHTAASTLEEIADKVDGQFMEARLSYGRAVESGDPGQAASAADQFEGFGALLFAAEAAALESRLADSESLRRRATMAAARRTRLLELCGGAATPGVLVSEHKVQLSPREREVALLAAQDLSSRDIAEKLFLSVRTVDNHLQRVYTKLGVNGRDELASALER